MAGIPSYRLAALLQDVGTVPVRARGTDSLDRTDIAERSATFVRERIGDDPAATLIESRYAEDVQLPEGHRRDRAVVDTATEIVSGGDDGAETRAPDRLRSVFAPLPVTNASAPPERSAARTYPLRPLDLTRETLFPQRDHEPEANAQDQYAALWTELNEELPPAPEYETLVNVLEKYTWCVPAGRSSDRELPLFDQLRTTTAVSDALAASELATETLKDIAAAESSSSEPLYTLVKGDLSGIQAFIHRLRNPDEAQARIAKRTRGRSIQLWLLTEGLARLFCERLGLPTTSLLWRGGGQFYALVPPGREAALTAFEAEVNDWLLDRFDGDIFFVQGTTTATDPTTEFPALFQQAANQTDQNKLRKGAAAISQLESAVISEPREPCSACGGDLEGQAERCKNCQIQEKHIGQALPGTEYLHLAYETAEEAAFTIDLADGGLSWWLTDTPDGPGDRVYTLNQTDFPETDAQRGFMFTGKEVPTGGRVNGVWPFVDLQQLGRGTADLMHVVKMDIDSLGEAIGTGMEGGPAHLAALSRALEVFFAGYVNQLARQRAVYYPTDACDACQDILTAGTARTVEHSREDEEATVVDTYYRVSPDAAATLHEKQCVEAISPIYIAFSGGDDMLFVGPWDEAIAFAQEVKSAFDAYTGGRLTLSGGFYLTNPKYPIGRATEHAEEYLDEAKQFDYAETRKNAATMFGQTLGWTLDGQNRTTDSPPRGQRFEELVDPEGLATDGEVGMTDLLRLGRRFEELIDAEELPRSTLHAFLDIRSDLYGDESPPPGVSVGKQKAWKIKYLLARNFDSALMEELEETVPAAMPWMRVPVSWASLATR